MTDRAEFTALTLKIQRALLAQAQLRALLTSADAAVSGRRRELRNLKARLARTSRRHILPG
jgi:hypothetical protein